MATLTSSAVASTVMARAGIDLIIKSASYTLTANPSANDIIQMVKVPAGATVQRVILHTADIDTNGTPTANFEVGDGNDTDCYITSTNVPRTGGIRSSDSGPGPSTAYITYTSDDTIDIKVNTASATFASGTVSLIVFYTMLQ